MIKASGIFLTLDDVEVVTIQCRQSETTGGKWWVVKIDGEIMMAVFPKSKGSTDIVVNHELEIF